MNTPNQTSHLELEAEVCEIVTVPVFLDTQYTQPRSPKLLSVGLTTGHDYNFYAALSDGWNLADCSEFVAKNVLPNLECEYKMTMAEVAAQFIAWCRTAFSEGIAYQAATRGVPEGFKGVLEFVSLHTIDMELLMGLPEVKKLVDQLPFAIRHQSVIKLTHVDPAGVLGGIETFFSKCDVPAGRHMANYGARALASAIQGQEERKQSFLYFSSNVEEWKKRTASKATTDEKDAGQGSAFVLMEPGIGGVGYYGHA